MTNLTAITTPFGLLDEETREALKAHGGPYEIWTNGRWSEWEPLWGSDYAYRVKPQPPKPREVWSAGPFTRLTREEIEAIAFDREIIHWREVLE